MINNSIFGNDAPKFIANFGLVNETNVLLNHWVGDKNDAEAKETIIESELSAKRVILDRGDYWIFSGIVYLFKYPTSTERRSKFEEIYQFNKKDVILYQHSDGQPFKDASGNEVLFFMTVRPRNLSTLVFKDILVIEFRSLSQVDFSDSSPIITPISEISMAQEI
jgi:hypothetical protein